MKEIFNIMGRITKKCISIQTGNYSPQIKDKAKRVLIDSVKIVEEGFSPQKINQLVVAEYRKKTLK